MFKLHIFVFLLVCQLAYSLPFDSSDLLSDIEEIDPENYDIIIDQRQNGTQNFRIKVSGVNIAIPDEREESPAAGSPSLEQLASLLSQNPMGANNDSDGFLDLTDFFTLKKNVKLSDKRKSDDTQSRTKDIPTDSQLAEDSKINIKAAMNEERRRYKVLVGEKYILPIFKFFKKRAEEAEE